MIPVVFYPDTHSELSYRKYKGREIAVSCHPFATQIAATHSLSIKDQGFNLAYPVKVFGLYAQKISKLILIKQLF